ncbi:RagB/SusD family nutrient uptake outer membrane protein [Pedobacter sp. AW31-3R]|uniref:RagB/SusD family nutrient uptake outer membrane protein n=1 Tax=Pedobacter sp. AW31-3R TaxID=3445781 RepID=UPI003FA1834C
MKKIYIYRLLFLSILAVAVFSCKNVLDVAPVNDIEQRDALKTSQDVKAALIGSYSDLGNRNFYGGRPFLMADLMGDNQAIDWSGTFEEPTQASNKSLLKTNTYVNNIWRYGYNAINDVNLVLGAIAIVDEGERDKVEGEAKFIRGSAHFDLVRLFGRAYNDGNPAVNPGVPLILTPTTEITDASFVERTTVAAVYEQVIKDLMEAESLLPEKNGFFATKYAATGMLARVYLQMGDYVNAADAANRVIKSGVYRLASTYSGAFPVRPVIGSPSTPGSNTPEDIFAMQVNTLTGYNSYNEFYGSSTYGGRGDAVISSTWIANTYEAGDDRINNFYDDGDIFTSKYANRYGNVSILRLAEMYLIRAESNQRNGGEPVGQSPLEDLSVIRSRAGLTTTSATLDDILLERKRELAFEGFFLHDAKRTETNVGNIAWNANALVFPIPQIEIDANNKLLQNPGYQ